eukprot:jgi/Tetstr1/456362/TSEL_043097.t1
MADAMSTKPPQAPDAPQDGAPPGRKLATFHTCTLDLLSSSLTSHTLKSYAGKLSRFAEFSHDSKNISPPEATPITAVRQRRMMESTPLRVPLPADVAYDSFVERAEFIVSAPPPEYQHDFRALMAAVVNFMFFAMGLTGVSCRVRDVHVDSYNIIMHVYREKGRAGRRGPDDLRVLLLPVSEHRPPCMSPVSCTTSSTNHLVYTRPSPCSLGRD